LIAVERISFSGCAQRGIGSASENADLSTAKMFGIPNTL